MASNRSTSKRTSPARSQATRVAAPEKELTIPGVPHNYQSLVFGLVIVAALLIFFAPVVFSNGLFGGSDFLSWQSFRPYLDMMADKGKPPLWVPYIFSGMPGIGSYLLTGDRWWDLTMKLIYSAEHVVGFVDYPVMRVVFHYMIYGVGMYLLMRVKKTTRTTALFVALAAVFSTWIIIYVMIGHNTKIMVLMTFPYIFLCLEKLIDRFSLLYAGLLIIAVHVMWEASHLQTAFYGAAAVGIYLLFELIAAFTAKGRKVANVALAVGVLVVAAGFTYAMGLDRINEVERYVPYSTRGAAPLVPNPNDQVTESGGHGWEYATNWSFSPEEIFTYVVPAYFGFGHLEYSGPETNNEPQQVPTYWGQMQFTDAAHYMGIAVLILGIFGAWMYRRNRFVQGLLVVAAFGLILSFGRTLPILYRLFYEFFPGFNKFRAPSQSLVLVEFVFPILAGFGLESLFALKRSGPNPKAERSMLYAAIGFGVFFAIGLLGGALLKDTYLQAVASSGKEIGKYVQQSQNLADFVYSTMITDWMFSGAFGLAVMLLMYYYLKGSVTSTVLQLALFGILIVDLWRIDYRPMNYQPADQTLSVFNRTDVDQFLASDTTVHRMMNLMTSPNYPAHNLEQHILGYHAAKLRNYQDMLDVTGNGDIPTSPLAWDLLNTRYIVGPAKTEQDPQWLQTPIANGTLREAFRSKQTGEIVYRNTAAMPRAWFVNRVDTSAPLSTLEKIRDQAFDPREVAFLTTPISEKIDPVGYTPAPPAQADSLASNDSTAPSTAATAGSGSVAVTKFEPLEIDMDVNAPGPGNNFLVVSEVNYPPGWRATIDGNPTDIIQTNYLLRGLVVPAGHHTIRMEYVAPGFNTGKWISLVLNLLAFGIVAAGVVIERRRPRDASEDEAHAEHA